MKYKAIKEIALKTALGYLEKDPEKNMPKLMNWVDKLAGTGPDSFESQRRCAPWWRIRPTTCTSLS